MSGGFRATHVVAAGGVAAFAGPDADGNVSARVLNGTVTHAGTAPNNQVGQDAYQLEFSGDFTGQIGPGGVGDGYATFQFLRIIGDDAGTTFEQRAGWVSDPE